MIDNRNGQIKDREIGRLVERICRRRESADADGVTFVTGPVACAPVASMHGMANSPVKIKTKGGEDLTIHFQGKAELFEEVRLQRATLRSCTRVDFMRKPCSSLDLMDFAAHYHNGIE